MSSVFRSQSQNTKIFGCCQHVGTNRHSACEQTPIVQGYIDHARIEGVKCLDAVCPLPHENASKDNKQKNDNMTTPARSITMCCCMHRARARSPLGGNLTAHFWKWTRQKHNDVRDRPIAALSFGSHRSSLHCTCSLSATTTRDQFCSAQSSQIFSSDLWSSCGSLMFVKVWSSLGFLISRHRHDMRYRAQHQWCRSASQVFVTFVLSERHEPYRLLVWP